MRRVSSRQRLVSWDAFDAVADPTLHEEEASSSGSDISDEPAVPVTQTIIATPVQSIPVVTLADTADRSHHCTHHASSFVPLLASSPLNIHHSVQRTGSKRSRRAIKSAHKTKETRVPTVIPALSWELVHQPTVNIAPQSPALAPPSLFDSLSDDVQLYVFAFLDLQSLRKLISLNKKLRHFVLHPDNKAYLCNVLCASKDWWPTFVPSSVSPDNSSGDDVIVPQVQLRDTVGIPCAAVQRSKRHKDHQHFTNLPLYCSWIPDRFPTAVNKVFARGCLRWRSMFSLTSSVDQAGREWIRYTGRVGTGDRCIRADQPLPRPVARSHKHYSFMELLCRGNRAAIDMPLSEWRPFCAPYRVDDATIDISPRMVAYFEVSIDGNKDSASIRGDDDSSTAPAPLPLPTRSDCVAVGLATESFPLYSRMPGWDRMSFGYHSDDGGVFHSSGTMLDQFGPSFGPGDTVGCGVDYVSQSIFYTLNGEFLGYAWKHLGWDFLQKKLYPVVGIDTNDAVWVNLGQHRFQFDLATYTDPHRALIKRAYTLHHKHASSKQCHRCSTAPLVTKVQPASQDASLRRRDLHLHVPSRHLLNR